MALSSQPPATTGTIAAAIASSVTRLFKQHTGRGPTSARAVIKGGLVVVVLGEVYTDTERRLLDRGRADVVRQIRQEFQDGMRDDLVAAIEMLLQRRVIACMGDHHVDPDMAVQTFVLEPTEHEKPSASVHSEDEVRRVV